MREDRRKSRKPPYVDQIALRTGERVLHTDGRAGTVERVISSKRYMIAFFGTGGREVVSINNLTRPDYNPHR